MKRYSKTIDGKCYSWFEDGSGMQVQESRKSNSYMPEAFKKENRHEVKWILVFVAVGWLFGAIGEAQFHFISRLADWLLTFSL